MTIKTEGPRNLGFLLSEANGSRSRSVKTIASGEGVLKPGTVLGAQTADGKLVVSPVAEVEGKEGAETATAVLAYGADATSADVEAVVLDADCEIKGADLVYEASVDDNAKKAAKAAQLGAVGIKVR